jgi:hypothetical protein
MIKLKQLITEDIRSQMANQRAAKGLTAVSKETGKRVYFGSKQAMKAAIKQGTHEPFDAETYKKGKSSAEKGTVFAKEINATQVNKLEKMPTPKTMEIDYIGLKGSKEKKKYKVVNDKRSGKYRILQLKDLSPSKKTFNNYELVIDERKLKVELRASMGYAKSKIADKILNVKPR